MENTNNNNQKEKDKLSLDNKKEVILNVENHSLEEKLNTDRHPNKHAENAVAPEAWKNQEKAYDEEWEKNKNQMLDDDF